MAVISSIPLCCVLALSHASAQRRIVFGFNSIQAGPWNSSSYRTPQGQQTRARPTSVGPGTQVTVQGNFGGTFTVNGIGTANSSRGDELIDITTNRALTFQAENFTILYNGGTAANTAGSITYEMQLYQGTSSSVGPAITSAVSGTDNMFNGATLVLAAGSIPSGGQVVLRLSRTLNLSQLAAGATTYTASGQIVLTIN